MKYIKLDDAIQAARPEGLNENRDDKELVVYAKGWNTCIHTYVDNLCELPAANVRPVSTTGRHEGRKMIYDELVKQLRDAAKMSEALAVLLPHSEGNATADLYRRAADAIEELSKPDWTPVEE